jgi:hypothetical protein
MDRQPFLPELTQAGSFLFTEGNDDGAKFVQVTPGRYAPLHSYQNTSAAPFVRKACECGELNPDAACVGATSALTSPFVAQQTRGAAWEFASPFEIVTTEPKVGW